MITIYLGDVGSYLADMAQAADNSATLLTSDNCNNLLPGTYYTSVADLENFQNLSSVLRSADKIVYAPPPDNIWSDTKKNHSQMQAWTEDYLQIFSFRTVVKNISVPTPTNKSTMLHLVDSRKTDNAQLWVAGCSFSHGTGVNDNERFASLLEQKLNRSLSSLTADSTSVIWAADQILRSDIRKDDIVVWGLTSTPRLPVFIDSVIENITPHDYDVTAGMDRRLKLDYFLSDDVLYRSVVAVYQVINYCQKIGARLLLASLLDDQLIPYFKDDCECIMLHHIWGRDHVQQFIDLGTDNMHPGPLTHEFYATEILKKINH